MAGLDPAFHLACHNRREDGYAVKSAYDDCLRDSVSQPALLAFLVDRAERRADAGQ
jgi:hypothetical protein